MIQLVVNFFAHDGLAPQGHAMVWRSDLITIHFVSDAIITFAFLTIPFAIFRVVRARDDIRYPWIGYLFAIFIAFCAIAHAVELLSLWFPVFAEQAIVKALCAIVSVLTVWRVWRMLPAIQRIPSPALIAAKNKALVTEIELRRAAEEDVRAAHTALHEANQELESRVEQRTAELRRANTDLEQFAYVASHDLRAPLRALMTLPDWIRETLEARYGTVDGALETDLKELQIQSRRMDQLLTDLLMYARIGSGGELERDVPAKTLIQQAVSVCGIPDGFRVRLATDLPNIRCVPTEFSLVMRNMILNAIKHHDRPSGEIRITARRSGTSVVFRVEDDGPGIAARFADKIFEMFSTLRPRDEVEGSGMGLAMVKKVIDRAGGTVCLVSESDARGAAFEISLPGALA